MAPKKRAQHPDIHNCKAIAEEERSEEARDEGGSREMRDEGGSREARDDGGTRDTRDEVRAHGVAMKNV